MRLVIDVDGGAHEVELGDFAESATLAHLVHAVTAVRLADDDVLWVDQDRCAAGTAIDRLGLLEGSRIGRERPDSLEPVRGWTATVSGGMHAGTVVPVPAGRPLLIGRSPHADVPVDTPSASWSHATVEIDGDGLCIRDAGSTNGTRVDGADVPEEGMHVEDDCAVQVGGAVVSLRRDLGEAPAPAPGSLHNLTPAGTAPFNRPPRPGRPAGPERLQPPVRRDPPPASPFSIATVLAPMVLAVVMVVALKNVMYALISGLTPILGVASWYEQKRRHGKGVVEEKARFDKAMAAFATDLDRAAARERARRRDEAPDPATVLRRAALPTTRLWQRRPGADDFLLLHAGVGDVPWQPPLETPAGGRLDDAVREVVDHARLTAAPVEVDLGNAGVVGVVGDRQGALALARSLVCQAAVHCGPADLTIGVFCDQGRDRDWSWAAWLPHLRRLGDGSGDQWASHQRGRSESLLRSLRDGIETHPTPAVLLVLDSDVLTEGRDAPARSLLGHGRHVGSSAVREPEVQVAGIVIASREEQLPAACTTVIHVREDAAGTTTRPGDLTRVDDVVLAGIGLDAARRCARDLARFDDPELVVPGAGLPSLVRLPGLLGLAEMSAEEIQRSWASSGRIDTPIGVGEAGPLVLDLVRDGPHGLVGGTTGSGKSEFLRSLVAGLAARSAPTELTFILIDFKGGAAFATCERLPHTIGTVSNLDEQLADRALRALEAELRYRQRVFAEAGEGVDNLDAYLATGPAEPMPRLLLVVDEFAMLAKEYPDVLTSLVSVAAVGRTLGVHMILATQRPAGVVNDDILANTNLRVALRVQSRDDSVNVIDVGTAAAIGRTQMGRAFVKLGQDDITPVQTALVTGRAETQSTDLVEVRSVAFGEPPAPRRVAAVSDDAPTDLDLLIDAIVAANDKAGFAPPRPVWPEPLGNRIDLAAVGGPSADDRHPSVGEVRGDTVLLALADDPDRQAQFAVGWELDRGNLLLLGIPGSGTSTTLTTLALTLAAHHAPDELDLLVLDLGSRDLAPLERLPHTAAYVGSGSGAREQQVRFLKYLRAELDRRRATPGPHRRAVVLLDGLAALREEYDDFEGLKLLEGLYRAYSDGPEVGMWFAVSCTRSKAVPAGIDEVTTQKWLFRLADVYDYTSAGVPVKAAPAAVPGRCVLAETKLQAHVATPAVPLPDAVARVAGRWGAVPAKPTVVGQLPERVTVADLEQPATLSGEPWRIPVGVRESDLEPAVLELYEGEHALVAGPARSGKSTTLLTIAESLRAGAREAGVPLAVWGVCGRRSPLVGSGLDRVADQDGLAALLAAARLHNGPLLLLVDDAEQLPDADQAIAGLLDAKRPDLHVVAAGRADDLRSLYGHWTNLVRKSRCGILLQPNVDFDGDLVGLTLPRKAPAAVTVGRGYAAVSGELEFVQCAVPSGHDSP